MFYYLEGKIALLDANLAVVDCGGVGYACFASNYTLSNLRVGETHRLFTHCNIKEDAFDIYGFSSRDELRLFELLIGVTGVGPTSALAILSELVPEKLALSISAGDVKAITRASGVGPKLAQRVILELKDKAGAALSGAEDAAEAANVVAAAELPNSQEAIAALTMLGYSKTEASAAVAKLDMTQPTQTLIKQALKLLSRQV